MYQKRTRNSKNEWWERNSRKLNCRSSCGQTQCSSSDATHLYFNFLIFQKLGGAKRSSGAKATQRLPKYGEEAKLRHATVCKGFEYCN